MNDSFATCALRFAGLACRQLSWRPADFWSATPAEIAAIFLSDAAAVGDGLSRTELDRLMERDQHG